VKRIKRSKNKRINKKKRKKKRKKNSLRIEIYTIIEFYETGELYSIVHPSQPAFPKSS
jgi:hypothetical protein